MLRVSGLHVSINGNVVLKGVDLSVAEGEIVALLGSNGAGKTTLARTISGQLKPNSGEIRWKGVRLDGVTPRKIVARGVIHCPEGRQLFGSLTVEENLRIACSRPGLKWNLCLDRLSRFTEVFPVISERWRQQASSLSGGEQQMVALVRAFIAAPELLIIDEVSLGLSPALIERIFHLIPTFRAEGVSILLVEQQARAALRIAARAYLLSQGSIVLEGSSDYVSEKLETGGGYFQ